MNCCQSGLNRIMCAKKVMGGTSLIIIHTDGGDNGVAFVTTFSFVKIVFLLSNADQTLFVPVVRTTTTIHKYKAG